MKAIKVRYCGATSRLPSRYIASDGDGNRLVQPDAIDQDFQTAAEGLRDRLGWTGELVGGWLSPGVYVFVFRP